MKLINDDCLKYLEENKDLKYDIVITDLPYGLTQNKIDKVIDLNKLWKLINGKPFITTSQQPFTTDLISSNRKGYKYSWYWNKVLHTNHLNAKKQPMKVIEEVLVFNTHHSLYNPQMVDSGKYYHNPKGTLIKKSGKHTNNNYGQMKQDWYSPNTTMRYPTHLIEFQKPKSGVNKPLFHPTEKPVELMKYLILTYTKPGDTVLDITMGSGTTGIACMQTGRNFIGIEMDKDIFAIAKERIENETI